ncbi:hypothetical protein AKJ40_01515 [candidate division MSBL1 archaeon SCGC-AAA259M10]|uniref:Anthranilate synthase component I N-terminal domain-containing protein n=1 Tax=candidate division MSBL1 archaeon SCGC-AAA259M10 TaxID=1698270 RepID=A0A133V1K2_9EURY|nr:hypothetical protein AKJ40_01515 [candidate division MSBL1 archaeon SCGC-AAA259M10]
MVDPSQIFLEVRKNFDLAYLLESLDGFRPGSRFSVIGCGSLFHLKFSGYQREVEGGTDFVDLSSERLEDMDADLDPLEAMKRAMFMDEMQVLGLNLPRYILGVTGYLSYDYVRKRIELESNTEEDLNHPLLEFALPESVIVFDHQRERTYHASLMLLTERDDFDETSFRSMEMSNTS